MILFQPAASLSEKDSMRLREEGQNLADSLQSPFIEVTIVIMLMDDYEILPNITHFRMFAGNLVNCVSNVTKYNPPIY